MNLRFEGTFSEVMELEEYPCDVQDLTMSLAFNTRTTGSERETPPLRPRRRDTATAALPHVCLERHACAALTLANATRRVCVSHRTGTLPLPPASAHARSCFTPLPAALTASLAAPFAHLQ